MPLSKIDILSTIGSGLWRDLGHSAFVFVSPGFLILLNCFCLFVCHVVQDHGFCVLKLVSTNHESVHTCFLNPWFLFYEIRSWSSFLLFNCPHFYQVTHIFVGALFLPFICFRGKWSPENLQKMTHEAVNATQQYVLYTYEWIVEQVDSVNKVRWSAPSVLIWLGKQTIPYWWFLCLSVPFQRKKAYNLTFYISFPNFVFPLSCWNAVVLINS